MVITRPPGQGCHLQQQWNKFHHWTKDRGHITMRIVRAPTQTPVLILLTQPGHPAPRPTPRSRPARPSAPHIGWWPQRGGEVKTTPRLLLATGLATVATQGYTAEEMLSGARPRAAARVMFPPPSVRHPSPAPHITTPLTAPPPPRPPQLNFQSKLSTSRRNWGCNGPGIVLLCVSALVTPNRLH